MPIQPPTKGIADTRSVRLPGITDRTVIIGGTGSGKTVAALWHLSRQPIDLMPWLIVNYKHDINIDSIPYAQHVEVGTPLLNGVYIVHPMLSQKEDIEAYLWDIWRQEDTGIVVDEGFMFKDSEAFNTILMQGRSKHIPTITNTQRPVDISRFVFSEASFIQVFRVTDKRDRKTISEFTPIFQDKNAKELKPYYSYYYDVNRHRLSVLKPVPDMPAINRVFSARLKPVITERKNMRVWL